MIKTIPRIICDLLIYACDVTGAVTCNVCYLCNVSHINQGQRRRRGWNVHHRNDTEDYMEKRNGTIYGYVFGTDKWAYGFMKIYGTNQSNNKWGYGSWHRESGHTKLVYKRDYEK